MVNQKTHIIGSVLALLFSITAYANIGVSSMSTVVPPSTMRSELHVYNNSNQSACVAIQVRQFIGAQVTQPASGLLVSPRVLTIPAHEKRVVHVLSTKPPGDRDRIYRLLIRSKTNQVPGLAYPVKVFVLPKKPHGTLIVRRQGKKVTIISLYNTRLALMDFKQCDGKTCIRYPLRDRNLYAKMRYQFRVKRDAPLQFLKKSYFPEEAPQMVTTH